MACVKSIVPVALTVARVSGIDSDEIQNLMFQHAKAKMLAEVSFHKAHQLALNNCKVVYAFQPPDMKRDCTMTGIFNEMTELCAQDAPYRISLHVNNPNFAAPLSFTHCVDDLLPHILKYYRQLIRMYTVEQEILNAYWAHLKRHSYMNDSSPISKGLSNVLTCAIAYNKKHYMMLNTGNASRVNAAICQLFQNFYGDDDQDARPKLETRRLQIISQLDSGMGDVLYKGLRSFCDRPEEERIGMPLQPSVATRMVYDRDYDNFVIAHVAGASRSSMFWHAFTHAAYRCDEDDAEYDSSLDVLD